MSWARRRSRSPRSRWPAMASPRGSGRSSRRGSTLPPGTSTSGGARSRSLTARPWRCSSPACSSLGGSWTCWPTSSRSPPRVAVGSTPRRSPRHTSTSPSTRRPIPPWTRPPRMAGPARSGTRKEMEFYTAKVLRDRRLGNPTVVVLTDRLDLDDQLFQTFSASRLLLERPVQVGGHDQLRDELLSRATGGIVFTTLQKFGRTAEERKAGREHPTLSTRKNVIVVADEAHRSHYDFLDGFARNLRDALPHATFIAFTGTPISQAERNTRAVFGDYIDVYDLSRAEADGATVRVFYENRHVPVRLPEDIDPDDLDERAAEAIAELPAEQQRTLQRRFRMIEQVVGAPERLRQVAADIVAHWEPRREQMAKQTGVAGKGLIVCLSRRVCALLYDELVALRPEWAHEADDKGTLKGVYDAKPSDPEPISHHARNESRNKAIQQRMREPDDELELVIVTSMWLTGFDCPPLHTLYLDKPMRGAALMQAITRVDRPFRDKAAGLIVDYIGITERLTEALAEYTRSDQQDRPIGTDISEAVGVVRE